MISWGKYAAFFDNVVRLVNLFFTCHSCSCYASLLASTLAMASCCSPILQLEI